MTIRPLDTTPEAWAIVQQGIDRMSPAERFRRSVDLTILAHAFTLAGIRRLYPEEDERRHRLRLAARIIDPETMRRAFNFTPDDR